MATGNLDFKIEVTNCRWAMRYCEHLANAFEALGHLIAGHFLETTRCSDVIHDELWAAAECARIGDLLEGDTK